MMSEKLQFLKLPTKVITDGLWANLSPAAKALYPVLLRFSDGNYCPVYPGSNKLLELTGFKQKSSIRRARNELRLVGLIDFVPGTGRTSTRYYFRFPWDASQAPLGGDAPIPRGSAHETPGGFEKPTEYNQIKISINQNVHKEEKNIPEIQANNGQEFPDLALRFGDQAVIQAIQECHLSDLPVVHSNIEKLLSHAESISSWSNILQELKHLVTPGSYELLKQGFKLEDDGVLFFSDCLPDHLRVMLNKTAGKMQLVFEPESGCKNLDKMTKQGRL